jgi:methylmalonyl-CoA mutase
MLTCGDSAKRRARAVFSCNFYACAGYKIIDNPGFSDLEEGMKAAFKAKANIIVLCSSDAEYQIFAPKVFKLIKNKAILVVAGAPACMDELKAKGIRNFIHIRSNVLETLQYYHKILRIAL